MWSLDDSDEKTKVFSKLALYRRILKILWVDRITDKEVLVKTMENFLEELEEEKSSDDRTNNFHNRGYVECESIWPRT